MLTPALPCPAHPLEGPVEPLVGHEGNAVSHSQARSHSEKQNLFMFAPALLLSYCPLGP